MSRADCTARLQRAIERSADAAGCDVTVGRVDATRWASATFVGARHELELRARPSAVLDRWLTDLPELELAMTGHLIADLKIAAWSRDATSVCVKLEILSVQDH